jgi:transcriptional regulator with XRE-family HTH domain
MGAPVEEAVGERIARVRHQRGWTQQQLADALQGRGCDLTRGAVAKVESGTRHVSLDEWLIFAAVLNAPPIELLAPPDYQAWVRVGNEDVQVRELRIWLRGDEPLYRPPDHPEGGGTARERDLEFHGAKPEQDYREWQAGRHRAVHAAQMLATHLRVVEADDRLDAVAAPDALHTLLDQDLRVVTRHVQALQEDLKDLIERQRKDSAERGEEE